VGATDASGNTSGTGGDGRILGGNSDSSKDADDCYYNQQFYERET